MIHACIFFVRIHIILIRPNKFARGHCSKFFGHLSLKLFLICSFFCQLSKLKGKTDRKSDYTRLEDFDGVEVIGLALRTA